MTEDSTNNPLKDLFNTSNSVLIILPPDPTEDILLSGISLHLSLVSSQKKSQIGCSSFVSSNQTILGINEVKESIGNKNLQITFDYNESNLDRIDYEGFGNGKFSLVIKPKVGCPTPDSSTVRYNYSGAEADLVIVFGVNSLEELGPIYADEKNFLDQAKILSLNTTGAEASFTKNMFHLANTSFGELIGFLLQRINLTPSSEASSNLLTSIYSFTKNLTTNITAETFSLISFLMKSGGNLPLQAAPQNAFARPNFFNKPADSQPVPTDWTTPKIFKAGQLPIEPADKY